MEKSQPLLTIRPKFDSTMVMIEAGLAGLLGTLLLTFVGGIFIFLLMNMIGLGRFASVGVIFTLFFLVGILTIPAGYYEIKRKALRKTGYLFHDDYLDYQDFRFFLTRRRGRIRYSDIEDIFERSNVLQGRFTLTSAYLIIPGVREVAGSGFPGLKISDIPEHENYPEKIVNILESYGEAALRERLAELQEPVKE